jgi:hypothetical protein
VDESIKHVVADNNNIRNRERRKKRRLGCQDLRRAQLFHLLFRSTLDSHQQLKMPEKYPEKITLEIHFFSFFFCPFVEMSVVLIESLCARQSTQNVALSCGSTHHVAMFICMRGLTRR